MENVGFHQAAILIAEWFHLNQAFEPNLKRMKEETDRKPATVSKTETPQAQLPETKPATKSETKAEDESITENQPLAFELKNLDASRECPTPEQMQMCDTPKKAAGYGKAHITTDPTFNPEVECFVVIFLNTRRRIKGHQLFRREYWTRFSCIPASYFGSPS